MKKCPFCAEEIQDDAIKCRFCGEFITALPPAAAQLKIPWYLNTTSITGTFLVLGPVAIPLVWLRKDLKTRSKAIITIVMVLITVLLIVALGKLTRSVLNNYQTALGL